MMPFELLPEAALEIREGIEYFDKEPPGKGVEFREAVYETIHSSDDFPRLVEQDPAVRERGECPDSST